MEPYAVDDAMFAKKKNKKGGRSRPGGALAGEATPDCRFPQPWTIEDNGDACFTSGESQLGASGGAPSLDGAST
jgi:hypothetical protein